MEEYARKHRIVVSLIATIAFLLAIAGFVWLVVNDYFGILLATVVAGALLLVAVCVFVGVYEKLE